MYEYICSFLIARHDGVKLTQVAFIVLEISLGLQHRTLAIDRCLSTRYTHSIRLLVSMLCTLGKSYKNTVRMFLFVFNSPTNWCKITEIDRIVFDISRGLQRCTLPINRMTRPVQRNSASEITSHVYCRVFTS